MEKYSFLKYVKSKEKIYRQKIINLQKQLGGTKTVDLRQIQEALLTTKMKLEDIKSRKVDSLIDPYNNLKDMLDQINTNIDLIDKNISSLDDDSTEQKKREIINKIRDIDIALSMDPKDYTKITSTSKINYVGERLNPEQITAIMDKYIIDTQSLIEEAKTKLGGGLTGQDTLVENKDFQTIFSTIEAKIQEFTTKLGPFRTLENKLKEYLDNMESLFKIELDPEGKPQAPEENANYLIDVSTLNKDTGPELDLSQSELKIIGDSKKDIKRLLNVGFLSPKKVKKIKKQGVVSSDDEDDEDDGDVDVEVEEKTVQPEDEGYDSPRASNAQGIGGLAPVNASKEESTKSATAPPGSAPSNQTSSSSNLKPTGAPGGPGNQVPTSPIKTANSTNSGPGSQESSTTLGTTGGVPGSSSSSGPNNQAAPLTIKAPGGLGAPTNLSGQQAAPLTIKAPGGLAAPTNLSRQQPVVTVRKAPNTPVSNGNSKYLSLNNKYIQEPDFKEVKVTDTSVNQSINNLYQGWLSKMSEYKSYLTSKKDNLVKAANYSKSIDKIFNELDKIIQINNLLQISNEKTETLKRDIGNKKTYYDGIKVTLQTEDVSVNDLEENYGKANLLEIQKEINEKVAKIKEINKTNMDGMKAQFTRINRSSWFQGKKDKDVLQKVDEEIRNFEKRKPHEQHTGNTELALFNKDPYFKLKSYREQITQIQPILIQLPLIGIKLGTVSFNKKYLSTNLEDLLPVQLGGEGTHIDNVIEKLREYEIQVRNMKQVRKDLESKIKVYNIRYVQYYNFQKYVVNYVSVKVAVGGYSYYQYVSKGLISYYQSLLTKLNSILDKFDNYKKNSNDPQVKDRTNVIIYGRHYFMIKILKTFFDSLYQRWDIEAKKDKETWDLNTKQFKTDVKDRKYWFLFNIFFNLLDEYSMSLPAIANYIRINEIKNIKGPDGADGKPTYKANIKIETFEKGSKSTLNEEHLARCIQEGAEKTAGDVSKIKFEEVFDPKDFESNDSLSSYMGLSNFLKRGKSIMILTYGYSGVGKTFTLFGRKGGGNGMLQSTLNYLGDGVDISVKAFELYGLGVPYKFYWRDPKKFCHFIYSYTINNESAKIESNVNVLDKDGMEGFLNKENLKNYNPLKKIHITNFSEIVTEIDTVRKSEGRIKATVNNPESSRSIMIYDFKINLNKTIKKPNGKESPYVHFVIMDLPGKENLYQTYCKTKDPNFQIDEQYRKYVDRAKKSGEYDETLLNSMFYINPLWLSLIPETSKVFDENNKGRHLSIRNPAGGGGGTPIEVYGNFKSENSKTISFLDTIYNPRSNGINVSTSTFFTKIKASNAHLQFQSHDGSILFGNIDGPVTTEQAMEKKTNLITVLPKDRRMRIINTVGLYGLAERSMFTIVNLIKNGKLIELGTKLNDMLKIKNIKLDNGTKTNKELKYGFAGLEGIYINENILGLLQVLANRVRDIKKLEQVDVVCSQIESYRELIKSENTERIPIDIEILYDNERNQIKIDDNFESKSINSRQDIIRTISTKIDISNQFFVDEDEFYSQIIYMKNFSKKTIGNKNDYNPIVNTSLLQDADLEKDSNLIFDTKLRNLEDPDMKEVPQLVNNYDYNKIFNISDPPIKKILQPYLDEIDNFYLFFVVSNNLKNAPSGRPEDAIETCDKQIKLLYDTKVFMNVISADRAEDFQPIQCSK
jgi:hypothetical protein